MVADPSLTTTKGLSMNKDQIKGSAKNAAGKVQEQAGKLLGSTEQQVKGLHKQAEGRTQKAIGDVKKSVKDMVTK
jgi:uncharacterized protein YjbJ (UPF0337 family)